MNFDKAFEMLIGTKGRMSTIRETPGARPVNISKRQYPARTSKEMTLVRAKDIYQRDYWWKAGCDLVPDAVKFRPVRHHGQHPQAPRSHAAAGGRVERRIGHWPPKTMQAISSTDPERLDKRFNGHRLDHQPSDHMA